MATYSLLGLNGPAAGLNMDTLGIGELARMAILLQSSTTDSRENPPPIGYPLEVLSAATISGTGLAYSALRLITGGSVSGLSITHYAPAGRAIINITGITGLPGATLQNAITQNDSGVVFSAALSGNDAISGGAGADLFHGSQDAGIDRVLDFHISEGDRGRLDPGTTYTISQVGADTVLDMGGGHQMILVGVTLGALPTGSIFLG